jgi:hypothetical protein
MANASNYLTGALIKSVYQVASYTPPTTCYLGLLSVTPVSTDTGSEIYSGSGGTGIELSSSGTPTTGYTRQAVTANSSNFPATLGSVENANVVTWSSITFAGTVAAVAWFDASTNGNLLFYSAITGGSQAISVGNTVSFAVDSLVMTLA